MADRRKRPLRMYDSREKDLVTLFARPALRVAGIDDHVLVKAAKRLKEALDAKEVKVATFEGKITDEKSYVDHGTRMDAAKEVFRMVPGIYTEKKEGLGGNEITVEIVTYGQDGHATAVRVNAKGDT